MSAAGWDTDGEPGSCFPCSAMGGEEETDPQKEPSWDLLRLTAEKRGGTP